MRQWNDQHHQEGGHDDVFEALPSALTEKLPIDRRRLGFGRQFLVGLSRRFLFAGQPVANPTELGLCRTLVPGLENHVIEEGLRQVGATGPGPGVGQREENRDEENRQVGAQVAGEPPSRLPGALGVDALPLLVVPPATHSPRG